MRETVAENTRQEKSQEVIVSGRAKGGEIRAAKMVEQQPPQGNKVPELPWLLKDAAVRLAGWESPGFLIPPNAISGDPRTCVSVSAKTMKNVTAATSTLDY